jgi:Protein of unknown function (DUF3313)
MNHKKKNMKLPTSLLSFMWAGWLLAGCSQTVTPSPNIFQRAQGETPARPPPSGFLGNDYSLLTPPAEGSDQQAMLRYTNANTNWSNYNAIIIAPVTFWAVDDSKVSAADQQTLCKYFDKVLIKELGKNFTIVDQPGPGVAKLSAALTDATSAVPVLRTISLVSPQARVLSLIKMATTGTYPFVGSAQGAARLTDSLSGQLLEAWADKQMGGASLKSVDVFWWGDAKNAMDYWANGLGQHLVTLGTQRTASTATAAYSKNEEPTPKERSNAWCEEQTFGIPTALTLTATPCAL